MTAPDLAAFLTARLDEDERIARAAVIPAHDAPNAYQPHPALSRWRYSDGGDVEVDWDDSGPYSEPYRVTSDSEGFSSVNDPHGHHIARHDPARVLADVDAKRRIIRLHFGTDLEDPQVAHACGEDLEPYPCDTLLFLALPYADHPDYNETWRPA